MSTKTLIIIHICFAVWFYAGYKFGKKSKNK